ncbi:dolichyl-diphosphooligosaccharide--protein glycosyltransferase subunit 1 [Kickxella alabastrina]|nr:dolichyl-diphosphooligosaccharide--protein glycosyltransferase subunit 1 [Kickxella alabastrina]
MRVAVFFYCAASLLLGHHATAAAAVLSNPPTGLVNTNLIRTVDLQALPYVHEQLGVIVQNDHPTLAFTRYKLRIPQAKRARLAQIHVHERKSGAPLPLVRHRPLAEAAADSDDPEVYEVRLRGAGLMPGEKLGLNIDLVFGAGSVQPSPAVAGQAADQVWAWADAALVTSDYATRKQKTVVKTRVARVGRVDGALALAKGGTVTFGPYTNATAADGKGEIGVHFVDNGAQMEAVTQRREYFVSQWADDLHVRDYYTVRNAGPQLDRFDKVRQVMTKHMHGRDNFIKALLVSVPADAREMYFVDQIGNVSTSAVSQAKLGSRKVLQLQPRYPLPGGWVYAWWHGYSVPLAQYLRRQGSRHHLRVPLIEPITATASLEARLSTKELAARNTAVTEYEMRVTLPEGASAVRLAASVDLSAELVRTKYYLDSVGRPVVVVRCHNVAPDMFGLAVVVSYDYSRLAAWIKPAVVAAWLLIAFGMASALSRVERGLAKKNKAKTE